MRYNAPEDGWADPLIVTRGLPAFLERTVGTAAVTHLWRA